jgi:hypothetical protein
MSVMEYFAVFMIGGAANGKSAVVEALFSVGENSNPGDERPHLHPRRWFDPDLFKPEVPLYSDDAGEEGEKLFGAADLGGPSGPRNLAELMRYPKPAVDATERYAIEMGFDGIAQFANEWLADDNPKSDGSNFGGGLTHELSKAAAQRLLNDALSESPPSGAFVWDAVGNADDYIGWIEDALTAGYRVRVVHVQCPLPVAQLWATQRPRRLPPRLIKSTYLKAQDAAREIQSFIAERSLGDSLKFESIATGTDEDHRDALSRGFSDDGPPEIGAAGPAR